MHYINDSSQHESTIAEEELGLHIRESRIFLN